MKNTSGGMSDPKIDALTHHMRADLFHLSIGVVGLVSSWLLHLEIGEWISLAVVALSLVKTIYRYAKRKEHNKQSLSMRSNCEPVRPALERDFILIEDIDCGWLASDPEAVIRAPLLSAWSEANPASFMVHVDATEQVKGYYSILGLRRDRLERFKEGRIAEPEFTRKDLLSERETLNSEELYFFSIAYRPGPAAERAVLLRHATTRLVYLQDRGRLKRLYAAAASHFGRQMIERLPFELFMKAETRHDHHDLYVLDLEKHKAIELLGTLRSRQRRKPKASLPS